MSWLFSRALVEASSAGISSDGGLYAPSSATPTPPPFSPLGKTTRRSHPFPSGMTCEPLTANRGEAVLTFCLAASPVRTSPAQVTGPASLESARVSGGTWRGSSVRWDRDSCSWKTVPSSPAAASESFSGTWPRWGTMRAGVCSELVTPAPPTAAIGSGSWPTPRACSAMAATITPESAWAPGRLPNLETVVGRRMWPTPTASEGNGAGQSANCQGGMNLRTAVRMWPTPMAHDGKDCGSSPSQAGRNSPTLPVAAGGKLNPTWVEWLMGWPLGWTDLQPLETAKFQQWRASHGVASEESEVWDSWLEWEAR